MKNSPKASAERLLMHYGISRPTLDNLLYILSDLGYELIDFDPENRTEALAILQNELSLTNDITSQSGFTVVRGDIRVVFVRENLSNLEKRYLIAHEMGHIVLGHLQPGATPTVLQEYEASSFANALISPSAKIRMAGYARTHKVRIFCIFLAAVILIIGGIISVNALIARNYYGEYYVTSGGNKYHIRNCPVIQYRTNVHRLTNDEFYSGIFDPCNICIGLEE